jgi:hypothetical protein
VDVGQRSGPSVQCLPRSHARFLCKVAASVRGPDLPVCSREPTRSTELFRNTW